MNSIGDDTNLPESDTGTRIRRLRLVAGLNQIDFATQLGIASGSVSKLENGQIVVADDLLVDIGRVLGATPEFLRSTSRSGSTSKPWLRAYADASKRALDRQLADCEFALDVISQLDLDAIPDTLPVFTGDLTDPDAIEQHAVDVRAAAGLSEDQVVSNSIRAAERLGCVVLPMRAELGRHVGLSTSISGRPVVCVARPSEDPDRHVPGDRQRFTVAHELGHLALHRATPPPQSAEDATAVERQAHYFAGAFLVPADALLDDLRSLGGRVTLRTLSELKERWGVAIKALVMRLRGLGVIDADHARSLHKQISARGWSKREPVEVGNERAVWFDAAVIKRFRSGPDSVVVAARDVGVQVAHLQRWVDWSPTPDERADADVLRFPARAPGGSEHTDGTTSLLPRFNGSA